MTSLIASPRQALQSQLPSLPVIEHPALRIIHSAGENNAKLQIRGTSREGNTFDSAQTNGPLPQLRRRTKPQKHSRVLTWPIGETRIQQKRYYRFFSWPCFQQ